MRRQLPARLSIAQVMIAIAVAAIGMMSYRAFRGSSDLIVVREYRDGFQPWNSGREVRIRLDTEHLHAYDLSKDDVISAITPSSIYTDNDAPYVRFGVVHERTIQHYEQFGNLILKANADGEIVRLKDVGTVEYVR